MWTVKINKEKEGWCFVTHDLFRWGYSETPYGNNVSKFYNVEDAWKELRSHPTTDPTSDELKVTWVNFTWTEEDA